MCYDDITCVAKGERYQQELLGNTMEIVMMSTITTRQNSKTHVCPMVAHAKLRISPDVSCFDQLELRVLWEDLVCALICANELARMVSRCDVYLALNT